MTDRRVVLVINSWPRLWSMGEGRGVPAFFLAVTAPARHGHDVHLLLPGAPGCMTEEAAHGIHVHRFGSRVDFMPYVGRNRAVRHVRLFGSYLWWLARSLPAGLRLAARVRPDVVVGMGELGAVTAFFVARRRGVPNVTRLFGSTLGSFLDRPWRMLLRLREVLAFRTPAAILVLCDNGSRSDEVARHLGVRPDRIRHWRDGIDRARFHPVPDAGAARAALGLRPGSPVVLSVSRLHPEKHVERLVAAAPSLIAGRRDVQIVIVGDGEERAALEDLARRLGVESHVRFLGARAHHELPPVYQSADLLVALSDRTNASNSVLEAMASGVPVVAVDAGGTREVITDGRDGVLLPPAELGRLPDVLLDLLGDEPRRRALGRAARESSERMVPSEEERQALEVQAMMDALAKTT